MDGSDFQKNKPQRYKIGIKNVKNEVFWRSHSYVDSDLKKKGLHLVFQSACTSRLQSFSKYGPSCEKLAQPCSRLSTKMVETLLFLKCNEHAVSVVDFM